MKTISKLLAILLVLALIFSLVACGEAKKSEDKETESIEETSAATEEITETTEAPTEETELASKDDIVGVWKYEMEFAAALEQMQKQNQDPAGAGDTEKAENTMMYHLLSGLFSDMSVTLVLELGEDGTYTANIDKSAREEINTRVQERLPELLPEMISSITGMTREELEAQLAGSDMTMDDMIDQYMKEFNTDELFNLPDALETGTYVCEDGKLVLTSKDGKESVMKIELSGDTLSIIEIEGAEGDAPEGLFPLVFTR